MRANFDDRTTRHRGHAISARRRRRSSDRPRRAAGRARPVIAVGCSYTLTATAYNPGGLPKLLGATTQGQGELKSVFFRALLDRSGIIVLCKTAFVIVGELRTFRDGPSWRNASKRAGPRCGPPLYRRMTDADKEWVMTGVWVVVT